MSYPLYAPDQLLPAVRDYLVSQGLVRYPDVAGTNPPLWLEPQRGVPYPGQKEGLGTNQSHPTLVMALYPATGIPSAPYEGFLVKLGVTVWYRAIKSPTIQTAHERVRSVLHDKRNLNLNGLLVNQSLLTRELQRLGSGPQGYVYNCEFMMDMWANDYTYNV